MSSPPQIHVQAKRVPLPVGSGKSIDAVIVVQCRGCCPTPISNEYACAEITVLGSTGIPLAWSGCWRDWSAYLNWLKEMLPIVIKGIQDALGVEGLAEQAYRFISWILNGITNIEKKFEEEDRSWELCTDKCVLFILSTQIVGAKDALRWCAPGVPCLMGTQERSLIGGFEIECPLGRSSCYVRGWDGKTYDVGDSLIVGVVPHYACGSTVSGDVRIVESTHINGMVIVGLVAAGGVAAYLLLRERRKRMGRR